MFGLEKNKKKLLFEFDLEKDLKDTAKQKELIKAVEKHIQEIKNELRAGKDQKSFEQLGLVLHGYSALLKVLTSVSAS